MRNRPERLRASWVVRHQGAPHVIPSPSGSSCRSRSQTELSSPVAVFCCVFGTGTVPSKGDKGRRHAIVIVVLLRRYRVRVHECRVCLESQHASVRPSCVGRAACRQDIDLSGGGEPVPPPPPLSPPLPLVLAVHRTQAGHAAPHTAVRRYGNSHGCRYFWGTAMCSCAVCVCDRVPDRRRDVTRDNRPGDDYSVSTRREKRGQYGQRKREGGREKERKRQTGRERERERERER
ncbi:hypothetical protein ALC62_10954 [Cyphomyrmex costatus]|uniref:Uncharacterized protein n=1 Tax=Cyphomyrmex costatus TaxID=456900 RepID=A0A151ID62_9HYME|nr:hypothetical protein ALC62_10954 [Cyphomyrmex costatus]